MSRPSKWSSVTRKGGLSLAGLEAAWFNGHQQNQHMVDQWLRVVQEHLYQCPFQIPSLDSKRPFFLAFRGISWHKTAPGTPRSNCRWPKVKVTIFLMVSSWCYTSSVTWISAGFAPWNWEVLFSMSLGTQFIHGLWKWVMLYHLSIIPIIDGENFWCFLIEKS